MNINKIREAIDLGLPSTTTERLILQIIAEDKEAIPMVMDMLSYEREIKKELISDMNLELSRADCCLENSEWFNGGSKWVREQISEFYHKFKGQVSHCFIREQPKNEQ